MFRMNVVVLEDAVTTRTEVSNDYFSTRGFCDRMDRCFEWQLNNWLWECLDGLLDVRNDQILHSRMFKSWSGCSAFGWLWYSRGPDVPNDKKWYTLVLACMTKWYEWPTMSLKGVSSICPNVLNSKQLYSSMFWPKVRCSSGLNIILFLIPPSLTI